MPRGHGGHGGGHHGGGHHGGFHAGHHHHVGGLHHAGHHHIGFTHHHHHPHIVHHGVHHIGGRRAYVGTGRSAGYVPSIIGGSVGTGIGLIFLIIGALLCAGVMGESASFIGYILIAMGVMCLIGGLIGLVLGLTAMCAMTQVTPTAVAPATTVGVPTTSGLDPNYYPSQVVEPVKPPDYNTTFSGSAGLLPPAMTTHQLRDDAGFTNQPYGTMSGPAPYASYLPPPATNVGQVTQVEPQAPAAADGPRQASPPPRYHSPSPRPA